MNHKAKNRYQFFKCFASQKLGFRDEEATPSICYNIFLYDSSHL